MRIMRMRIMLIAKKWRMAIPIVNWLRLLAFFLLLLDFHWLSCFLLTSTAFKWLSSVFLRISTYFYCLSTDFIQTFYWLLLREAINRKQSILRKSFIKRWPPSVGVLWKSIFFRQIRQIRPCEKYRMKTKWLPPFAKLFRKIDFLSDPGVLGSDLCVPMSVCLSVREVFETWLMWL